MEMVIAQTVPDTDRKFIGFLTKYGDVRCHLDSVDKSETKYRVIAGDEKGEYTVFIVDGLYTHGDNELRKRSDTYVSCTIALPDHNNGDPMRLVAVRKDNGFRRLDAWGEKEHIPFP